MFFAFRLKVSSYIKEQLYTIHFDILNKFISHKILGLEKYFISFVKRNEYISRLMERIFHT